jgi:hypothetical protein
MTDEQRNIEREAQGDAITLIESLMTSVEKTLQIDNMLPSVRLYYQAELRSLTAGRDAMVQARDKPEPPPGNARSARDVLELLLTNPPDRVVAWSLSAGMDDAARHNKLHELMQIHTPCPHCQSVYVYGDVQTQHDGVISGALFCAGCGVLILRTLVD